MLNKSNIYFILLAAFLMPTVVLASDPTGLFVFFVAIPLVVLSFLCLLTSFFTAIGGMAFALILLLFHMVVFIWGYDIGYMDSAGGWVLGSLAIIVASFVIAYRKQQQEPEINNTTRQKEEE